MPVFVLIWALFPILLGIGLASQYPQDVSIAYGLYVGGVIIAIIGAADCIITAIKAKG